MATLVDLGFTVNTNGIRAAQRELGGLSQSGRSADRALDGASNSARLLNQALAAGAGLLTGKKIIDYADAWKNLNAQIRQVTDSEEMLVTTRSRLLALSSQTRTSLEATTGLYSNLRRATQSLGLNQMEVMDITKTINNLFLAGGKGGAAAAAGITQLSQAFASGVLRGDEFNSVAENAPRILDALGQKLGKTRGELRAMAEAGQLSATVLSQALMEYSGKAQDLANTTEKLFAQSVGTASDNLLQFVGASKTLNTAIDALGSGLENITANMDKVTDAATILAVVIGAKLVGAGTKNAATALIQTKANIAQIRSEQSLALGIEHRAAIEAIAAKSAMTTSRAQTAAALATVRTVRANMTATQSVAVLMQSEAALAATRARLAVATLASAEAATIAAAATARLTIANEAAAATGLLAMATAKANAAMALLGGPVGLAIIAAAGIYYFMTKASDASKELEKFNGTLDDTIVKFKSMGEYGQKNTINTFTQGLKEARQEIANLEKDKAKAERGSYVPGAPNKIIDQSEIAKTGEKLETAKKTADNLKASLDAITKVYNDQLAVISPANEKFQEWFKTIHDVDGAIKGISESWAMVEAAPSGAAVAKMWAMVEPAEKISAEYKKREAELKKEIALFGVVGSAAEISYDIQNGGSQKFLAGEGEKLVALAKTKDALELAAEKQKGIDELNQKSKDDADQAEKSRKEGIESIIDGLKDQERQLTMTAAAYQKYTLEQLNATDAQKAEAELSRKNIEDLVASKKATDDNSAANKELIKSINEMGGAWSRTGSVMVDAFGTMADALDDYSARQEDLAKKEKAMREQKAKTTDPKELAELGVAEKKLAEDRTKANINGYAKMSGAAAKMFSEQSKGRKALNNAEKVFTAVEIALSLQKAGANAVEAISKAYAAPFPLNFAAGAAMIGIMSGLGLFGGGSSGDAPDVADMQTKQGTGSVLGSSDKSESIADSLERFNDVGIDQLAELRGIRSAMTSLSNGIASLAVSLVTGGNVSGKNVTGMGTSQKFEFGGVLSQSVGGGLLNKAFGAVFGTTKKSLEDTGLSFEAQELGDIFAGKLEADYYNTIKTTKKNLIKKKTSYSDELTAIDDPLNSEISRIFNFLGDSVQGAIDVLGVTTGNALSDFMVDIGKISFKDLSGEEIQAQLEAVFSKQGDLIAEFMLPQIDQYQKMGEGAYETLMRVAQEQAVFNDAIDAMGLSLGSMSNLLRVDVAQSLIDMMGGLEEFSTQTSAYADKFFTEQEKLAGLTASLGDVFGGIGMSMPATRDEFRDLVKGIDLASDSGQALFATMMKIAPSFDSYVAQVEKLNKSVSEQELQILEKTGRGTEALAIRRERELAAMNPLLVANQKQIWLLDDLTESTNKAATALKAHDDYWKTQADIGFQMHLETLEKTGRAELALKERREKELAAMEPVLRKGKLWIWHLDDMAAAAEKAATALSAKNAAMKELDEKAYSKMLDALTMQKERLQQNAEAAKDMLSKSFDAEKNKIQTALDVRLSAIDAQHDAEMNSLDKRKEAASDLASSLRGASNDIKAAYTEMTGGISAGDAQKNILGALSKAWRGDFSGALNLSSSLDAVKGGTFSSAAEERIFNSKTVYALDTLGKLTGNSATVAEKTLEQLTNAEVAANLRYDQQKEKAQMIADTQITKLDAQLNSLLGINTNVTPLNQAIREFNSAQTKANAFNYELQVQNLEITREQLGRLDKINKNLEKALPVVPVDKTAAALAVIKTQNKIANDNAAVELALVRRSTTETAGILQRVELDGIKTRVA